jgi:hypothetical protein
VEDKVDYKFESLQFLSVSIKIMKEHEMGAKCNNRRGIKNAVQPGYNDPG